MKIPRLYQVLIRRYCNKVSAISGVERNVDTITVNDKTFKKDDYTNLTPRIVSFIGKNIHNNKQHPLCLTKQHIINFFYENFLGKSGNPIFSVYDSINPIVTVEENFDSLLVPQDHVSRQKTDCYYFNKEYLLRAHTSAHQAELIQMGLDNFLVFGDCYRRDDIDKTHFPVFHQADGVYTLNEAQIQSMMKKDVNIFEDATEDTEEKQKFHSLEVSKFVEDHLKSTLVDLTQHLYKKKISYQWVPAYFPFTHPSWELEIQLNDQWVECLGCGIIRHEILKKAGAGDRIGWAFGLGLERLAMHRYQIPDIRIFWSNDTGFTHQFEDAKPDSDITFTPISHQPQCSFDISFFMTEGKDFDHKDFYDMVRNIGNDYVEQVKFLDEFFHPKKCRKSRSYRITYRRMDRPLNKEEVHIIHNRISNSLMRSYDVEIRR